MPIWASVASWLSSYKCLLSLAFFHSQSLPLFVLMKCDQVFEDPEFGHLYVKRHPRAVKYTFKAANDGTAQCGIFVTAPKYYDLRDLLNSVERMRPKLRLLVAKLTANVCPIDWNFSIQSDCLHISLIKGDRPGFFLSRQSAIVKPGPDGIDDQIEKPARLELICPEDTDFQAEGRQAWLEKVLVEGLRTQAKLQLPRRLLGHAQRLGINVREVKINVSKSHWGSCACHKTGSQSNRVEYYNINLSAFTLLLPIDAQRLILLHELMHTRHMDHSTAFHHDLDQWLGGREDELEAKLKKYQTNLFSFRNNTPSDSK